jgi:hypothetical protein
MSNVVGAWAAVSLLFLISVALTAWDNRRPRL